MAPRNTFPTETDMQQLEQEGFSHDQIAGLLALRALYTQGSIMRMIRSASDRNLSAGSTCKVVWKARTLSQHMHPLGGHTDVAVRGNHHHFA
jgi:hypothetical protein